MSVGVVEGRGVTVVTVASDSESCLPPLCQILKHLCCGWACCSAHKGLVDADAVAALGTIQIMVGLFNIGLGPGRDRNHYEDLAALGATSLLGGVYLAAGLMSVLAGRFPSVCSVGFAVFVNVIGSIFAVVGIVVYALDLGDGSVTRMCDWVGSGRESPDGCRRVADIAQSLLTAVDVTMIVLAVLQLCVCISVAALGSKALLSRKKQQADSDVEIYQPLMKNPGA